MPTNEFRAAGRSMYIATVLLIMVLVPAIGTLFHIGNMRHQHAIAATHSSR